MVTGEQKKQGTVLVVEDDRPLSEAIMMKLEKNGFSSLGARSVDEAQGALNGAKDVVAIWLDHYLLGKQDGLDFLMALKREDSTHRTLPLFVVSNTATPDKMQSYLNLGATRYYVKAEHRLDEIIADIKATIAQNT